MSRITDIAIGIVLGAGGIIGAAFTWDKYENSDTTDNAIDIEAENDTVEALGNDLKIPEEGEYGIK